MFKKLNIADKKLEGFLNHCVEQFVMLAQKSIIKPNEAERAMKIFSIFLHDAGYLPASSTDDAELDVIKHSLQVNKKYAHLIDSAKTFNDQELDKVKQTLFHEFIHILQYNYNGHGIAYRNKSQGVYEKCLDEVAASIGVQYLWRDYLIGVKQKKEAKVIERWFGSVISGWGDMLLPIATESQDETPNYDCEYAEVVSVVTPMLKATDMPYETFVRGSTVFGGEIREKLPLRFVQATGNQFDKFKDMANKIFDFLHYDSERQFKEDSRGRVRRYEFDVNKELEKIDAIVKPRENIANEV